MRGRRQEYISALEVISASLKVASTQMRETSIKPVGKMNVAIEQLDTLIDSMKGDVNNVLITTKAYVDGREAASNSITI